MNLSKAHQAYQDLAQLSQTQDYGFLELIQGLIYLARSQKRQSTNRPFWIAADTALGNALKLLRLAGETIPPEAITLDLSADSTTGQPGETP